VKLAQTDIPQITHQLQSTAPPLKRLYHMKVQKFLILLDLREFHKSLNFIHHNFLSFSLRLIFPGVLSHINKFCVLVGLWPLLESIFKNEKVLYSSTLKWPAMFVTLAINQVGLAYIELE